MGEQKPVSLQWELETPASIEATWALFGDTDRYNRAVGFGYTFTEEPRPDGTVRRVGRGTALGVVNVTWEERPFRYRVPEWFQSTRLYEGGPAERLVTSLNLEDLGGRTRIRYTIEVYPRSFVTRPVVALQLKTVTRPKIDAVIQVMLSRLAGGDDRYDPLPEPLSSEAEQLLLAAVPRVPPPAGERLATFLREAPETEQAQIHPLRIAQQWDVDEDQLLDSILAAVREGLLELRWDLLCPQCRGPKSTVPGLAKLDPEVHCPSCNIVYDGTFPDSVVVSFRPPPSLRRLDIQIACLGSPARQPHVLAQDRVDTSGSRRLRVKLEAGAYRIRTLPGRETASLIVREGGPTEPVKLVVQKRIKPSRTVAAPGEVELVVDNFAGLPLEVLVEERALPEGILTMGRLLERPGAKELLPTEALMPGVEVLTRQGVVLALEALDEHALGPAVAQVEAAGPRCMSASRRSLVAVWEGFPEALGVASVLAEAPDLQLALNSGPVTEVTLGARVLPVGATVDAALAALVGAAEGHAAIPVRRAESPEVREALGLHATLVKADFALTSGVTIHWIKFEHFGAR